ncbi:MULTISPECIES: hypothetical protein [Methylobacterium]|uniref:Uncharacterized protein n=2 Tax=Methylobacterium TaxID=407 RepID=A0A0C6FFV3_9HYPH|nr:hypothetical protein [Methylobacterium aquaticum]QRE77159.1 hypothetical protein F1D61_29725 [Methylobacterium aquaticum]BAQ45887.1 hypothetical protein Maq22A_c13350 [Methylobacterium aquaticum]
MTTKVHVLKRALQRRERDALFAAAALSIAGGKAIVFHAEVVDDDWRPIPGAGLDLVVKAATSDDAYTAWEHHDEDVGAVGAVGKHRVKLTYVRPATEERPAVEMESLRTIDLDMRCLLDELGDLYDEEDTLGTVIPGVF